MARRGRKPKTVEPKDFLFSNDSDYNTHHTAGTKGNLYSSAAKFMNLFPKSEKDIYMTPVKKGERLGYGKYRIEAHHPNKHSDDRDAYEAKRQNDVIYKNPLTKPSRIKYDGITNMAGYHLITHDRDGKRVEFWLKPYKAGGATVMAEMYLPDLQRRRAKKGKDGNKLMSCAVEVGKINASATKKGELKFTKSKPKAECAKYGNSNAKYGKPLNPKEYEKQAESQETFLSEDDMIYFYAMTGQEMDLSDYQAINSVEVDRTSYQPTQDYGAESDAATYAPSNDPDMVNAIQTSPSNENPVLFAEGDAATYSPSSDPDMVNSIPTEPTNAEADLFGSQGYNDKMDESMGMRDGTEGSMQQSMKDRRDEASAMDKRHSMMGRKYDDVMTMDAQGYDDKMDESLGMRHRGSHSQSMKDRRDEASAMDKRHSRMGRKYDDVMSMDAESKNKWVKGKDGKTYVLRKKTGHMVTHNAESPGGAYPTLEDFNGMESVVVEPPMGHGVAQWYAEGNAATYTPSDEPDMVNEIQTEPTNANADLFGSETLAEIEGPTAEATAGGLHSPSSFDISWEDGNGLSSASMPPNEIAWAENKETYCAGCKAAESGCHCSEGYDAESLADYQAIDSIEVDATSYQPTQDYGSEFEGEFADDMKKGAAYGLGGYAGFVGFGLIASSVVLAVELIGRKMGE
tara:strand:- start:308 stop:2359 length:2052 start_codon:yes stop_codon:yes gene_type:complete